MTEGVAQDGKASSVLQDMGKVLGHIHRKWLFCRSDSASLGVGKSNKEASFSRNPRGSGTRGNRMLSDRDAVGGRVAALGRRPDGRGVWEHNDVARWTNVRAAKPGARARAWW